MNEWSELIAGRGQAAGHCQPHLLTSAAWGCLLGPSAPLYWTSLWPIYILQIMTYHSAKLRGTEFQEVRPRPWLIQCEPRVTWAVTEGTGQEQRPSPISPNDWGLAKGLYSSSQSTRPQVQGHWCSRDIIHQELAVCHRPGQWSDDGPCGVYEKTEISEWFIAGAGLCSRSGSGTPVYAPQSLKHALTISSTGNVSPPWGQRCDGLWKILIGDLFLPPVDGLRTKYDLKLHQTMPWASWNQQSWPTLWASRTQMLKEEEAGEGLSNSLRVKGKLYDFKGVLKSTCTGMFIRNQNNLLSKKLI